MKEYNLFPSDFKITDFSNKEKIVGEYMAYMFCRTQDIFIYEGLPDSIPQRNLELLLQGDGYVVIPKSDINGVNGNFYAFGKNSASLGGEPNVYFMPTKCVLSSPALNFSDTLTIGENCVVIPNDSLYLGFSFLFSRYASLLAENDISIRMLLVNSRVQQFFSASDDATKKSAIEFLEDLEKGKIGVVSDKKFFDDISFHSFPVSGNGNAITQLIEMSQYLKASWYNEIGLNANYNMKREAINTSEAQMNNDALTPLIEDMFNCRKRGFDELNKKFGTNISVKINPKWGRFSERSEKNEVNETD